MLNKDSTTELQPSALLMFGLVLILRWEFHYVAQAGLEFTLQPREASNLSEPRGSWSLWMSIGIAHKEMRRWPGTCRKTRAECPRGPGKAFFCDTPDSACSANVAERPEK